MRSFLNYFIFGVIADVAAVFINPYSYGSYDPAAENPAVYQYYARYYNPNPHNPYAPYPTHMKPGYFTLPRMYQIDPAYASRYPPNYAETLPLATYAPQDRGGGWGTPKSETQILLERLDAGSNVFVTGNAYTNGISKNKYSRPRWIDTQPSPDVTSQFAAASGVVRPALRRSRVGYQRNTPLVDFPKDYESNRGRRPKYPDSSEATSSEQTSSEELSSSVETDNERPSDTERLPLDRVSDTHVTSRPETKTEKEDDVFSQITDGRTLRAVKRVRQ